MVIFHSYVSLPEGIPSIYGGRHGNIGTFSVDLPASHGSHGKSLGKSSIFSLIFPWKSPCIDYRYFYRISRPCLMTAQGIVQWYPSAPSKCSAGSQPHVSFCHGESVASDKWESNRMYITYPPFVLWMFTPHFRSTLGQKWMIHW